jgi:Tfp pilus assembly protein PilF
LALIARLPRTLVHVEPTYKGLKVTFQGSDGMLVLGGGVHAKANATDRAMLTLADQQLRRASEIAQAASEQSVLASNATQIPLAVIKADPNRRDRTQMSLVSARARLRANDAAGAMNQLDIAIRTDGADPELRAFRAMLSLSRGDVGQARSDSLAALTMDPDNPQIETISSTVLFQCDLLEGKPDLAMQWIERSLRADPFSASAHTRRAEALLALGRAADARLEFRKAVAADPTSALAVARLARLELAEGWLTTGRRLIQKAVELSAMLNQRIPEIQVAQAQAVLALGFYGNAKSQIAEASRIAEELLADKACDLPSAIGAYGVLIRAALLTGDIARSDALLARARGLSPTSPAVLIEAASTAHQLGRNDLARKYVAEAAKLAPDNMAIQELNRVLAQGR